MSHPTKFTHPKSVPVQKAVPPDDKSVMPLRITNISYIHVWNNMCIHHARYTSLTLFNSDLRKLLESQGLATLFDNFVREDVLFFLFSVIFLEGMLLSVMLV